MIGDLFAMFEDPHARHAIFVHLPIVFGLFGIVPCLALAVTGFKSRVAKAVCIAWFLVASAGAGLAAGAGEEAAEGVEATAPTPAEKQALESHEELGDGGWIWPLIPAALVALTLAPKKQVRLGAGALAILASIGVAVWIGETAHRGGKLVYVYGLGVPARGTEVDGRLPPSAIPAESGEHDDDDD